MTGVTILPTSDNIISSKPTYSSNVSSKRQEYLGALQSVEEGVGDGAFNGQSTDEM